MKTILHRLPVALVTSLFTGLVLAGCSGDEHGHDHDHDHGHTHADGTTHHHDDDGAHAGEPTLLHEGTDGGFESLTVTWLRTEELGDEVVVIVDIDGGSATIRGRVRAADGAESIVVRADAEGGGEYHLHMGELPSDLDLATATAVLDFEPEGGEAFQLALPFTP